MRYTTASIGSALSVIAASLIKLLEAGEYSIPGLVELFAVSRATVYRVVRRAERARLASAAHN